MSEPIRLLIVDDHPLLRDGIVACLGEDPGVAVIGQAGNGEDALREARRLNPDLVLMDIDMPVMDGIEATRRLRDLLPGVRVLILSMHNHPHQVEQSLAAGACGYVLKNTRGAELLRVIRAVHLGGRYVGDGVQLPGSAPRGPAPEALSEREVEVLRLITEGLANKEIARRLGIGVRTVEAHRLSIRNKLGISKAGGLARYAMAHGLCPDKPGGMGAG